MFYWETLWVTKKHSLYQCLLLFPVQALNLLANSFPSLRMWPGHWIQVLGQDLHQLLSRYNWKWNFQIRVNIEIVLCTKWKGRCFKFKDRVKLNNRRRNDWVGRINGPCDIPEAILERPDREVYPSCQKSFIHVLPPGVWHGEESRHGLACS